MTMALVQKSPRDTAEESTDSVYGWGPLGERALEANPFFSPAIARASLAHLGGGRIKLAAAASGGRTLAFAPIAATRLGRIAPAVGVWTHRYGPLGTPLLDRDRPDEALVALVGAMAPDRTDGAILLFPDLPLDGPVSQAIRRFAVATGRPVREIGVHRRAALTRISVSDAPFRQQIERRRRKEYARQWRRLAEQGELTVQRIVAGPDLERAALSFLALEARGWKGRRGTSLAADPQSRAFAMAAILDSPAGAVAIDEIALGGEPVAMLVSFRSGGLAVTWKIAHDEAFARFSPGVQVMLEATEAWLADPSLASLDSLAAADHPMIDGLWPERIRIGLLALGPAGGSALFRAGVLAAEAEAGARRRLRAWRHRGTKPRPEGETET